MEDDSKKVIPLVPLSKQNRRKKSKERLDRLLGALQIDLGDTLNQEDMFDLVAFVISATVDQIEELQERRDLPIAIHSIIKAVQKDIQYGRTNTVFSVFNRLFGSYRQNLEVTGADGSKLFGESEMSREGYAELIKKLQGEGVIKP